jgi:nitrogen fixation protein FixH
MTTQISGRHVLFAMLAFFASIIAVNVGFAIVAVRSFPGEDTPRSYLQGLRYNDTLAERQNQAALGWRATTGLSAHGSGAALLVSLNDRAGVAIDGAELSGDLQWPAASRYDRRLNFEALGGGRYRALVSDLAAGRWRLRARAERGGEALDFESDLTWRQ